MGKKWGVIVFCFVLFFFGLSCPGYSGGLWEAVTEEAAGTVSRPDGQEPWVKPDKYLLYTLDQFELQTLLAAAPLENLYFEPSQRPTPLQIILPAPDGTFLTVDFVESPVMAPELSAKFPEIRTYLGQAANNPSVSVRFDFTPAGFHAQVLEMGNSWYIDPYIKGESYASYYRRDRGVPDQPFECFTQGGGSKYGQRRFSLKSTGGTLRTYRLAVACTGEYGQFHGGTAGSALAAIVTAVNRVTGIYEIEFAIRLQLIANNNLIVFTNPATDPFTGNSNAGTLIGESQTEINNRIGAANYDIGHTFSTGAGGYAGLGVVCSNTQKARGVTGRLSPTGDPYYVDYVAHEMGHQFGGDHTFNGTNGNCSGGNRNGSTAYEPGSGSTIMAYAGICYADDLQSNSDAIFHSASYGEIVAYTTSGFGATCDTETPTGNAVPTVSAGNDYTIPAQTPFCLTGSGSDTDAGDVLSYLWEQRDLGPQAALSAADDGQIPLFRVWTPTSEPVRYCPRLETLRDNTTDNAEKIPQVARVMDFRLTVRDNRAGGGGVNWDDMVITVNSGSGPFLVISPNGGTTESGTTTVTWDVAGTTASPVSCATVNIYLSTDRGMTWDLNNPLASSTPNDGSHDVHLGSNDTTQARIMVKGDNNIFFDISNADFTITPADPCPPCSDPNVVLTGDVFPDGINCDCTAGVSITADGGVIIKIGTTVTFTAPLITLDPNFTVQSGASFTANQ